MVRHTEKFLPYSRQAIGESDIEAVISALTSGWLTTGPKVSEFETAVAAFTGANFAVAVSSGTAALHGAVKALAVVPGDEVIVPAMTFAATANAVVFEGGTPVFADVDPETLLLDLESVKSKITERTRAIIAVDYAGQPCDYDTLNAVAAQHSLQLIADASHSLGASYRGRPCGTLATLSTFSFHPVKPMTTAEGGMITTANPDLAQICRNFRNHGITTDHRQREATGSWFYEMVDLGYNYRLSDLHCALGLSQLTRLPAWMEQRRRIAATYDEAFLQIEEIHPLRALGDRTSAHHLYVIRLKGRDRATVYRYLREQGIGVNVHYIPVHYHPFYQQRFGTKPGICPAAEAAYEEILSLPIFPGMRDEDCSRVIESVFEAVERTV